MLRSILEPFAPVAGPFIDSATGLPSRVGVQRILQSRIESGQRVGVLLITLDGVDDAVRMHGHRLGERALKSVASHLGISLPLRHSIGIWGNSELLVIVGVDDSDELLALGMHVVSQLECDAPAGYEQVVLSARVGGAISRGCEDGERLIHKASLALPSGTVGAVQMHSADLEKRQIRRLHLKRDIRFAARRNELTVVYQPQIHIETGRVVGAEALLRWEHSDYGPIRPDVFIPLAEESGDIIDLGEWVIDTVSRQVAAWSRAMALSCEFCVAVNVSPRQVIQSGFAKRFCDIVSAAGLQPSRLAVEVTETGVMMDLNAAAKQLSALRAAGVGVAVDDFGTGESSLAYMKQLPVSILKMDRSFVNDLCDHAVGEVGRHLAEVVVFLAQGLGCSVVAEGVETEEQHLLLRDMGCEVGQGYFYGRPMPPGLLMVWGDSFTGI